MCCIDIHVWPRGHEASEMRRTANYVFTLLCAKHTEGSVAALVAQYFIARSAMKYCEPRARSARDERRVASRIVEAHWGENLKLLHNFIIEVFLVTKLLL